MTLMKNTFEIWRLIVDDLNDPFFNMGCDEAIAKFVGEEIFPPTLRFYRWKPATLSLGFFQKFEKEIDFESCQKNNISVVRRITGGRAVLHDDEITYSICIPSSHPIFEKNIINSYKIIAEALAQGLKYLGLNPEFSSKKLPAKHSSGACFDAPSIYEITINGKKIIGSAQKRFQKSFLQHGSIPFTIDSEKLFSCFKIQNNEIRKKLIGNFKSIATGICDEIENRININDAINAFTLGFEKIFNIKFNIEKLSEAEKELINKELYQKYCSLNWLKKY